MGIFALSACNIRMQPEEMPASEATPEEQQKIQDTLQTISDFTTKFGPRLTFDQIPIIVTTENWKATDRIGYCQQTNPRFIAVNRMVMAKEESPDSSLFIVLLHEIGHCYFDRPHVQATLSKPGFDIAVYGGTRDHGRITIYGDSGICVSVMCTRAEKGGHSGASPEELNEYYVGEMLGKLRATQLSDFERFANIRYLPKVGK